MRLGLYIGLLGMRGNMIHDNHGGRERRMVCRKVKGYTPYIYFHGISCLVTTCLKRLVQVQIRLASFAGSIIVLQRNIRCEVSTVLALGMVASSG